jgi:hypothetical protein
MIDFMKQKLDIKTMMGKLKLLSYIYKYLMKIGSPVEQDLVFGLLVKELDVSVEALKLEFGKFRSDPKNFAKTATRPAVTVPAPVPPPSAPSRSADLLQTMGREFMILLLLHTDKLEGILKIFNADDFGDPMTRKAFDLIVKLQAEKPGFTIDDFLNRASDPELASVLTGIMFSDKFKTADTAKDAKEASLGLFSDYRDKFHVRKLDRLIDHIKKSIIAAQNGHDASAVQELQVDLARSITDRNRLRTKTG